MKAKKYLLYSFLIFISIIISVFILMVWSDTFSNIHTDRTYFYTSPNKNVIKVDYILKNKTKFDSFIFGSSRVFSINPLKIKNGKYFNMTHAEQIPKEHLLIIKLFIKSGIKIKNILIALDEFSYQVSFKKHQSQGLTKSHYLATGESFIKYCRELYLRFPLRSDRDHIKHKLFNGITFKYDVREQYKYYEMLQKSLLRKNYMKKEHMNSDVFNKPTFYNGNTLKETIKDIQEIKNICKNNDINCTFLINPIHQKTYEYTNKKLLNQFRKELSNITPYYDFSYPSFISKDNSYWIETSHYLMYVGDMMIDTIYNNKKTDGFGKYIKKLD
jgi:hypothetical protein